MGIPSLEVGLFTLLETLVWASLGRQCDGWMSLSLISCSSLGSVTQLIFWAFFFMALHLVKNNDFKGHLHRWSGVINITFPFQETNTDFIQCCWWLYIVSSRVPLALTHFCNCTGTPTQLIWTQASKLEMIVWGAYTSVKSLRESRENPWILLMFFWSL